MKPVWLLTSAFVTLSLFAACSDDPPEIRVINNNAEKINISVKPDAGSTININDVASGATSGYVEIPEGAGTISGSRTGTSPEDIRYAAEVDNTYEITVSSGDKPSMAVSRD